MKQNYFKAILAAVVAIGLFFVFSCGKDKDRAPLERSNYSTSNAQDAFSPGVIAYERKVPKAEFLDKLKEYATEGQYDSVESNIDDTLSYIILNDNGKFQEYLRINSADDYIRLSSESISNIPNATVQVEIISDTLNIDGIPQPEFLQFTSMEELQYGIGNALCCAACFAVHDALGIRMLDCFCCLGNCVDCGEILTISWQ